MKIVLVGLGFVLLIFLLRLLWLFWLRQYLEWQNVKSLEIKERVGLKIEFIKTAAQILGGIVFLITIYVAVANLKVSREKYKTDFFDQAIKQLGDAKVQVRLAGIYSLECIARDSKKDHGPIMEILTTYVRLHAPWPPEKPAPAKEEPTASGQPVPGKKKPETKPAPEVKPTAEIQAILTVIGRLGPADGSNGKPQPLDLGETDLRGAQLREARLDGALFWKARLDGAVLWKAHLDGADLREAHLDEAKLSEAHLDGANLEKAVFKKADLNKARIKKAKLREAILEEADIEEAELEDAGGLQKEQVSKACKWVLAFLPEQLSKELKLPKDHKDNLAAKNLSSYHLENHDLRKANLKDFNLQGAFLSKAQLDWANLEGADLRRTDLTHEQIVSAIMNDKTQLPEHLK